MFSQGLVFVRDQPAAAQRLPPTGEQLFEMREMPILTLSDEDLITNNDESECVFIHCVVVLTVSMDAWMVLTSHAAQCKTSNRRMRG